MAVIALIGYWVVGLPVGLFLAFPRELGPRGLWWGLTLGLVSVAAVIVLSAPRIIGGGHWFSDVYLGALAIALLTLPWVLCTACAARLSERLQHGLARLMSRLDH